MDRDEALTLLASVLSEYRTRSYAELRALVGTIETPELIGPSGTEYGVEIEFIWDSPREKRVIRVAALIDDGRFLSGWRPVCDSFLMGPNDGEPPEDAVQPAVVADGASPRR